MILRIGLKGETQMRTKYFNCHLASRLRRASEKDYVNLTGPVFVQAYDEIELPLVLDKAILFGLIETCNERLNQND